MAQANGFSWRIITENTEEKLLDFSVNVNPLGIPGTVKKHIAGLADITGGYPDPDCRYLRSCLAEKYQVGMEQILCGNGADDLLYRLVLAVKPKRAIVIEPTFEEYGRALKLAGCEVDHYVLKAENDFLLDDGILSAIQKGYDMMFLCNLWKEYTAKSLVTRTTNLIVIDAFTKTYSLAGFRLGFCASGNTGLLSSMRLYGQNFAVSTPAQLAGICALKDDSYMKNTYHILSEEREWLAAELGKLPLEVYPSQGNFLLLRAVDKNIRQMLFDQGIKVRDCSRFYGLNSEYCRIAIRAHDDNRKLIKALSNIFS